jgi:hypothetical protein
MQDRMGSFFEKNNGLPMYKDKPYSYASSRRRQPAWQQKRVVGIVAAFFIFVLYLLGFFSSSAPANKETKSSWSFFQGKGDAGAGWLDRRESVKKAFTLSWDAYEQHGWGMSTSIDIMAF